MFFVILVSLLAIFALILNKCNFTFKLLPPIASQNKTMYSVPNGPWKLPFLGNLLQMLKDPHLKLSQWAEQYGDLYSIHLVNKPALVINNPKLVKELFGHAASTGKFQTDSLELLSQGPYGILSTEGKTWSEQKQFCVRALIKFGFGSGLLEPMILDEIHQVSQWIEKETRKNGGTVVVNEVLMQATNNILWAMVSGKRVGLDDFRVVNLLNAFLEGMQYTVKTGLAFFPWLKYLAPSLSGYTALDKACKDLHTFVRDEFEEHKRSFVNGNPRDVIDSYIEHMENTIDPKSQFYGELGMKNSVSTMVEIFVSAGDTSSATLSWLLYYLCWNPKVQQKLCEEIDMVIGQDREPSLMDKPRMPYTEAVILETFRYSSLVPLGVIHRLTDDLHFQHHFLPKGLLLIPNLYYCHHSKDIWKDPQILDRKDF